MSEQIETAPDNVRDAYDRLKPMLRAFALALPHAKTQADAARAAGYSDKTARSKAASYAALPDVVTIVQYLTGASEHDHTGKVLVAAKDSCDRIAQELECIAYTDPIHIMDDNDNVLPIRQWPEHMRRAVASVEVFEEYEGVGKDRVNIGRTKKVRFWDKIAANNSLAKLRMLGGYAPKDAPVVPPNVNNHFYGGVVVLPAKDSGRGRSATEGAVIEGEVVRARLPAGANPTS
jgi:phage terminase small subunit